MKTYKVTIDKFGTKRWYNQQDQLHNEEGPAVEYSNGDKYWCINDKRHREDGPAVECADGIKLWYINGEELTEKEFNKRSQSCDGKVVEIEGKKYILKSI